MGFAAFVLGLALLGLGLWAANAFVRANPGRMAQRLVWSAMVLAVVAGVGLIAIGKGVIGFPLLALGASLFSRHKSHGGSRTSRLTSPVLEIDVDHGTGAMTGRVIAGRYAGRDLAGLSETELSSLRADISGDALSRSLLEEYLHRRSSGGRHHRQGDAQPGRRGTAGDGPMGPDEAYQILGLQPNAGPEEIRRAHRALMKKLHPDQGGSTYLASRVNQAKDILLRRHR